MAAGQAITLEAPVQGAAAGTDRRRYLYGPVTDFICMGGSSLIFLPLVFLQPPEKYRAFVGFASFVLSYVLNQPHFAHSYQIFYRGFRNKVAGPDYGRTLRLRYIFAGIVVPLVLALFLLGSAWQRDVRLLGLAANAMFFFVGWHYVKQGYGILMVDAALRRRFFTATDKTILLVNTYAVWLYSWLWTNSLFSESTYSGLKYSSFAIPPLVVTAAFAVAVGTTLGTLGVLARRWAANGWSLPYNGVVGYVASVYAWLLFGWTNPLWLILVPALHSLQYLAVVWRFETNYEKGQAGASEPAPLPLKPTRLLRGMGPLRKVWSGTKGQVRFGLFVLGGIVLGYLLFRGVPGLLNRLVPYDRELLGAALFGFIITVFVNVHHYFLDNVMWRRENPETRRYLFG